MLSPGEICELMDKYLEALDDCAPFENSPDRVAVTAAISTLLEVLELEDTEHYLSVRKDFFDSGQDGWRGVTSETGQMSLADRCVHDIVKEALERNLPFDELCGRIEEVQE
jgi:hypothetical protein